MNYSNTMSAATRKLTYLLVIMMTLLLGACAGKGKAKDGEVVVDMTRPPSLIKDISEERVESNPEETISFEQWSKERKARDAGDSGQVAEAGATQVLEETATSEVSDDDSELDEISIPADEPESEEEPDAETEQEPDVM